MHHETICDLSDCSEFRQTVQERAPAIMHATALLSILLLGAAVTWAALAEANLVVQAPGRVRPVAEPSQVFMAASVHTEGRVAEVWFREGEAVSRGQVLLRFNTDKLDNEIARLERRMETANSELTELNRLHDLLLAQFASEKSKAQAELAQAEQTIRTAKLQRESRILEATAELDKARDRLERCRRVAHVGAVTDETMVEAETQFRLAQQRLTQAQLPVEEGQVAVLTAALETVDDDFDVRLAELSVQKVAKEGEMDGAAKELANLQLAKTQATLRAPIDGVVVSGQIDVGDILQPGKPSVEIAAQDGFRFEVAVASSDVGDLKPGMPVKIKLDAYDYQKYGTLDGTVCFISPDSRVANHGTDEAPAAGPLAYVVRVELQDDEVGHGDLRGTVKLGLGGTAEIVAGRDSILAILFKKIRRTISLG